MVEVVAAVGPFMWPLAVILGAVVILLFRKDVRGLADRIEQIGPVKMATATPQATEQKRIASEGSGDPTGVRLQPQVTDQKRDAEAGSPDADVVQLKPLRGRGRTQATADLELRIHSAMLSEKVPDLERVDLLVHLLAEARIDMEFERIYRLIFGSQIRALKILNQEGRITVADARTRFQEVVAEHPDFYGKPDAFDNWLGFGLRTALVINNDDVLMLSPLGYDFLHFLTRRGYSEDKVY